jgi:hypothetical protein
MFLLLYPSVKHSVPQVYATLNYTCMYSVLTSLIELLVCVTLTHTLSLSHTHTHTHTSHVPVAVSLCPSSVCDLKLLVHEALNYECIRYEESK